MRSLPLFHRIAGKPVIVLGEGEAAEAKRRLVERAGGVAVIESAEARLACAPHRVPAGGDAEAGRLRARGLLANVLAGRELRPSTTPSLVDRAQVLVAVGPAG